MKIKRTRFSNFAKLILYDISLLKIKLLFHLILKFTFNVNISILSDYFIIQSFVIMTS